MKPLMYEALTCSSSLPFYRRQQSYIRKKKKGYVSVAFTKEKRRVSIEFIGALMKCAGEYQLDIRSDKVHYITTFTQKELSLFDCAGFVRYRQQKKHLGESSSLKKVEAHFICSLDEEHGNLYLKIFYLPKTSSGQENFAIAKNARATT